MNQRHGVVAAVEADGGIGHVVHDDGVHAFAETFLAGIAQGVLGFGGEAHHERARMGIGDGTDDVVVFLERDVQIALASLGAFALLQLLVVEVAWAVVRHGGHGNEDVRRGDSFGHRVLHLLGAYHVDALHIARRGQLHWAGNQRDIAAGVAGGFGQGETLTAGTAIADETHRIEKLAGRAGGDQHLDARQRLPRSRRRHNHFGDFRRLGHSPRPPFAARLFAIGWPDHANAVVA